MGTRVGPLVGRELGLFSKITEVESGTVGFLHISSQVISISGYAARGVPTLTLDLQNLREANEQLAGSEGPTLTWARESVGHLDGSMDFIHTNRKPCINIETKHKQC